MHSITNDRALIQLIEGPAGTGKSTLNVNLILQLLHEANTKQRRIRIFLGAFNDASVDQLALKLAEIAAMMDGECKCGCLIIFSKYWFSSEFLTTDKPALVRFGRLPLIDEKLRDMAIDCYTTDPKQLILLETANIICTTLDNTVQLYKWAQDLFDDLRNQAGKFGSNRWCCDVFDGSIEFQLHLITIANRLQVYDCGCPRWLILAHNNQW